MLSIKELGKVYGCTHAQVISFITHTYQNICSVILLKFRHHISHMLYLDISKSCIDAVASLPHFVLVSTNRSVIIEKLFTLSV